jgi:hypothetical protein
MAGLGKWLVALREHPDRLDHAQHRALVSLAVRLDWKSGDGFASIAEVAVDADCGMATVKRAITWARERGLLVRTAQGRHVGRGSSGRASEYRTCVPSQQITHDLLPTSQGVTGDPLPGFAGVHAELRRGSSGASQGITSEPPSKSYTSNSYPSKAQASAAPTVRAIFPDLTDDETRQIVKTIIREHQPRNPSAYVTALAASGDLARYVPCDTTAPGPHSEACRRGDGRDCGMDWCECRCHRAANRTEAPRR